MSSLVYKVNSKKDKLFLSLRKKYLYSELFQFTFSRIRTEYGEIRSSAFKEESEKFLAQIFREREPYLIYTKVISVLNLTFELFFKIMTLLSKHLNLYSTILGKHWLLGQCQSTTQKYLAKCGLVDAEARGTLQINKEIF